MKTLVSAVFIAFPMAASAVESPPGFPDTKLEAPPMSLVENSLQGLPGFLNDFKGEGPIAVARQMAMSRMPIIPGASECDPKMVKTIDPSVDYKGIIKDPEIEQEK
jgi:hypothetical protein